MGQLQTVWLSAFMGRKRQNFEAGRQPFMGWIEPFMGCDAAQGGKPDDVHGFHAKSAHGRRLSDDPRQRMARGHTVYRADVLAQVAGKLVSLFTGQRHAGHPL